ncbi:glutathione S-transferase [Shimia isoporae]|uniref:Glutathione S-transferase n=1 Tax=Shimia isoporae TaxID=647720 RepID=A0A4R1N2Q4_9RHOB|nr:glutathione S-transferase family protein [Shimia isoporae]TCL00680.1 glutathione S-transferase [Shimia isoporae]
MYEVIGSATSRAFRVMWLLEELGQPYEHAPENPHSDRVKELNPSGKIPVLMDGDTLLTDSTAILTYLADKHGALTYPAGTVERAKQDGFTQMILDEIEGLLWTASRHTFILPKDKRVPELKDTLIWEFERNIRNVMSRANGPYLMGEMFTVPDIILTQCATWAKVAGFPTDNEAVVNYIKGTRSRPAFRTLLEKIKR